jgi:hypothetical protein
MFGSTRRAKNNRPGTFQGGLLVFAFVFYKLTIGS